MALPDDVAAEINQYVDRVLDAGRAASVDPIQIELVDKVLRPYLHVVENARETNLAPNIAEHAVVDVMANFLSEYIVRIFNDDGIGARVLANQMMLDLAKRTATCLEHNYGPLRPGGNTVN